MQGIGPLVFPERLAVSGDGLRVTEEQRVQMKMVCMHTIQQQVKMQHVFEQAWQALEQAGIEAVVLKGVGLAAFYPSPEQRAWSDIDLFVGNEQYHAAARVMRDTFPEALKFDEELDHYKHYNLIADGVSIEVHRVSVSLNHPRDVRRYARMEYEGVRNAHTLQIADLRLQILEPTFNALFVFLHSWEHMLTAGGNVRQIYDLAFLLQHYQGQLDTLRLKRWLKALRLLEPWQLYMYMIVHELGMDAATVLFYSDKVAVRAEALWTDLIAGRMVAPKADTPAPKNKFARKWHTMQERMLNAERIRQYSPAYARHMREGIWLSGLGRLFAKDRHWE